MTNKKNSQPRPLPLFDYIRKAEELSRQSENPAPGSLDIDSELRAAVSADIKACPLSRFEIASRMSELAGQDITCSMLNNWTAETHEKHRFPCQYLPAFIIATGGRRAFEVLSRRSGLFALPGPEVLRVEIQKMEEQISKLREEKRKRTLFLKEMEGRE